MVARLSAADGCTACGDILLRLLVVDGIFRRSCFNGSSRHLPPPLESPESWT